jgi:ribosomal protein S18 acetylase RimI-like enzyme
MNKFAIIQKTETSLQNTYQPPRGTRSGALGLWKDLAPVAAFDTTLGLHEVVSSSDLNELYDFRLSLESYSPDYLASVKSSLTFSMECMKQFGAKWYLLTEPENEFVGEIGIVPFDFDGFRVGRLQDVEVHSQFRGHGYGNILLKLIEQEALRMGLSALCLKARPEDWPVEWYKKNGFLQVGAWS